MPAQHHEVYEPRTLAVAQYGRMTAGEYAQLGEGDTMAADQEKTAAADMPQGATGEITVDSKYGRFTVFRENAVFFPRGLVGLPKNLHFCVADFPDRSMGQFKVLQSLNDHSLSFVVLPLDLDNPFIERRDLEECSQIIEINPDNMLVLLIVSVHRLPSGVKVTANVRAPIIIDATEKLGVQYVFPASRYQICHPLV